MECNAEGKPGYKYGESGHCYTYTEGNEEGRKAAKHKAILQGTAIAHNSNEKLELSKEDYEELGKDFDVEIENFEPVIKDDSNHFLFGWAYVAKKLNGEQVIDHSEEFVKEENFVDLELATYLFNIAYRQSDIRHSCIAKGYLIDSMVFTREKVEAMRKSGKLDGDIALGVWMGFWFPEDEDWNTIKEMKAPMFSLYGKAIKELVEEV
jgi:hypothetical protein